MQPLYKLIWALLPGIITGIVLAIFTYKYNKATRRQDEREKAQRKERKLNLDLTFASAQLAYACAMAIKRGKPNGEIEEAVSSYEKALISYREFEREQIALMKEA